MKTEGFNGVKKDLKPKKPISSLTASLQYCPTSHPTPRYSIDIVVENLASDKSQYKIFSLNGQNNYNPNKEPLYILTVYNIMGHK